MKRFNENLFGDLYKTDLTSKLSFDHPSKSYMIVPLKKVESFHGELSYEIDYKIIEYGSLSLNERIKASTTL